MKRVDRVKELLRLARALDYEKDPNPEHWKTINGAKVHVDKNGKYDGGAGGKFNGDYHFGGADWKDKKARIESLANIFNQAVAQKQAQANAQGNGQGKYPHGARLKLKSTSMPLDILPLKDGGDKFIMIGPMGHKIKEYPGGMQKFLEVMEEKGHFVSERPVNKETSTELGGTTREQRRNARRSKSITRSMVRGRPETR